MITFNNCFGHHSSSNQSFEMSEKLCLQWNSFNENANSAFRRLREDKEFTDVTLVCEDGQQMEAHKVILAASSPFFEEILQKSRHPRPLIYLRGYRTRDFVSILDFLYFCEANVFQEDLDSFLAIVEEIKLKGLTGQTSSEILEEQEKNKYSEPVTPETKSQELLTDSPDRRKDLIPNTQVDVERLTVSKVFAIPNQSTAALQLLDEKVKSMMEKGQKMIQYGNGVSRQDSSYICKVCGKEGLKHHIIGHIEANHLEGMSLPCNMCDKSLSSRNSLREHKISFHK